MIFHHHKIVFFHIGKTGGTSMEDWLWPGRPQDLESWPDVMWGYDRSTDIWLQHATPADMQSMLEQPWPERYFTFTIVRDPFARFLSAFHYDRPVNAETRDADMLDLLERLRELRKSGTRPHNYHFLPQTAYLFLDGKPAMDHVGRLEDVSKTVRYLSKRFQIQRRFPRTNVSRKPITRDALKAMPPRAVELILDLYADDFRVLGYSRKPGGRRSLWFRSPVRRG